MACEIGLRAALFEGNFLQKWKTIVCFGACTGELKVQCGGKHGWWHLRRKARLQFFSGSLTRRGLPVLVQALADVFVNADKVFGTNGDV